MSASDNLSNELFFDVHRGMAVADSNLNPNLGVHWSRDESKATEIGAKNVQWLPDAAKKKKNVVVHANLPISSVETNTENLKKMGWGFDEADVHRWLKADPLGEKEVMAKKGAKLLVTGQTTYTQGRKRTRRYNPPREMKA